MIQFIYLFGTIGIVMICICSTISFCFREAEKFLLEERVGKKKEEEQKKAALLQYHQEQIRAAQQRDSFINSDVNRQHVHSFSCAICLDTPPTRPNVTMCGHVFCEQCILHWRVTKAQCPTCRQRLSNASNAVHPIFF